MDDLKDKLQKKVQEKVGEFQKTDIGQRLDREMEKVSEKLGEKLEKDETLQKIAMGILQRAQKVKDSLQETGDIISGGKEIVKRTGKKVLEKVEEKMASDEDGDFK